MNKKEKLPQNLVSLIGKIGEELTLFKLYVYLKSQNNRDWSIYKNYEEKSCDLILSNKKNGTQIKLEVKTRQGLYSTETSLKTKNIRGFEMTESEYYECDYLISYWMDYDAFFIIPKSDIPNPKKGRTTFRVTRTKNNNFGKNEKYYNNWNNIKLK